MDSFYQTLMQLAWDRSLGNKNKEGKQLCVCGGGGGGGITRIINII